ncbi:hypothetical protein CUMW_061550 [Citrus unshiu]|uniref:Uncharacterized protein n=1 Tax=Citrus unshiu TaxID=55188 RepID=A0A2H5NNN7_CITUN|nr:hypothetical protein CUMW_061550 [Citrus unshiu]
MTGISGQLKHIQKERGKSLVLSVSLQQHTQDATIAQRGREDRVHSPPDPLRLSLHKSSKHTTFKIPLSWPPPKRRVVFPLLTIVNGES